MASVPHGADADAKWVAACTAPDVCVVGGAQVPFDTSALLNQWDPANPETYLRARGLQLYREGDLIEGVLGNAGAGVHSGVSLGTGHVLLLPPPPHHVFLANRQVIVDENECRINTDPGGGGGVPGQVYTDINDALGTAGEAHKWTDRGLKGAELANTRTAYRGAGGQFIDENALSNMPVHERAGAVERIAKPGAGGRVSAIRGAGKVLGPVGTAIDAGSGVTDQLARDAGNAELTDTERYSRAATRGGLKAGGSAAGGALGAKIGAGIGVWFAGWGAIPGAIIGGAIGGWLGGEAGDAAADHVLEPPAPRQRMSGAARRKARTGR